MPFINMKNRYVLPLHQIAISAIRYVYAKKGMSSEDVGLMQKSIINWTNKIDLNEDDRYTLQTIAKFLKKDEQGEFEDRKDTFKKHGINFMKFHRMPHLKEMGDVK